MQISELQIDDEHDTISANDPLALAAKKILGLARGVLVVVQDGKPLGTMSDSHLLLALYSNIDCRDEICKNHMDSNFLAVNLTDTIEEVSKAMKHKKPSAVVVVDESGMLSGYFSPNDYRELLSSLSS